MTEWDWDEHVTAWQAFGFAEDVFWRSTPAQIARAFVAVNRKLEREHNDRAWHAWHIAALQRTKKLPPLKKLLMNKANRRQQTWQEQKRLVEAWISLSGGSIISKEHH